MFTGREVNLASLIGGFYFFQIKSIFTATREASFHPLPTLLLFGILLLNPLVVFVE
jgi:hypothetical protein